jgi:hypothetical protein
MPVACFLAKRCAGGYQNALHLGRPAGKIAKQAVSLHLDQKMSIADKAVLIFLFDKRDSNTEGVFALKKYACGMFFSKKVRRRVL